MRALGKFRVVEAVPPQYRAPSGTLPRDPEFPKHSDSGALPAPSSPALRCIESLSAVRSDSNRHQFAAISNRTIRIARPKTVRIADINQKTREGCGCPKSLAGKVFGQISTLLEHLSPIFRQHEILSLPRFGHFPARKIAAGKSAPPFGNGTLLDFLPLRPPQPS